MMTRITTAILCTIVVSISSVSRAETLSFGSPAPEFSGTMLRGEPIDGITKGDIHVIEFGGTKCVPCIKFIPEMNALQARYPDVVFVSVFCESLATVEPFMEGPGNAMRVRVATDDSGRMRKEWLDAAGLQAIPQAFIVDRSGRLAWFGYPDESEFGEILERVVQGNYDGRLEFVRTELNRKQEENRREQFNWIEKLDEFTARVYTCGTPQESIALIDKSMPEFANAPDKIRLSIMKLHFYKTLPGSRERSYQHALSLAVEAIGERNPHNYVSACTSMLSHCEFALPDNRDARLADLALVVLLDEAAVENHRELTEDGELDYQVKRLAAIANAHRLRGDLPRALEELERAIAISRQRDLENKKEWWLKRQKRTLLKLESQLTKWKEESKTQSAQ